MKQLHADVLSWIAGHEGKDITYSSYPIQCLIVAGRHFAERDAAFCVQRRTIEAMIRLGLLVRGTTTAVGFYVELPG